jgi:hypothetical protein
MTLSRFAAAGGLAVAVLSFAVAPEPAQARPKYRELFAKKYENLKEQVADKKCFVCHPNGDDKKVNNDYGAALKKALGTKNEKDVKKIDEALTKIEKEPSKVPKEPGGKEMKTFGDLIKENKLPGTNPEEKK